MSKTHATITLFSFNMSCRRTRIFCSSMATSSRVKPRSTVSFIHTSLLLLSRFNKTQAAIFHMQRFSQIHLLLAMCNYLISSTFDVCVYTLKKEINMYFTADKSSFQKEYTCTVTFKHGRVFYCSNLVYKKTYLECFFL